MKTMENLATEARSFFQEAQRHDGSNYWRTADDAPEWMDGLALAAHDFVEMLPNDWRYQFIVDALDVLTDIGDGDEYHEHIDSDVSVYSSELCKWLGSHSSRAGYVDSATAEYGRSDSDGIINDMMRGQYMEREEVFHAVRAFLSDCIDESEDAA